MLLIDGEQFDVEDEGGAAGDAGLGEFSVSHFGRNIDFPAVADVQLLKSMIPFQDRATFAALYLRQKYFASKVGKRQIYKN